MAQKAPTKNSLAASAGSPSPTVTSPVSPRPVLNNYGASGLSRSSPAIDVSKRSEGDVSSPPPPNPRPQNWQQGKSQGGTNNSVGGDNNAGNPMSGSSVAPVERPQIQVGRINNSNNKLSNSLESLNSSKEKATPPPPVERPKPKTNTNEGLPNRNQMISNMDRRGSGNSNTPSSADRPLRTSENTIQNVLEKTLQRSGSKESSDSSNVTTPRSSSEERALDIPPEPLKTNSSEKLNFPSVEKLTTSPGLREVSKTIGNVPPIQIPVKSSQPSDAKFGNRMMGKTSPAVLTQAPHVARTPSTEDVEISHEKEPISPRGQNSLASRFEKNLNSEKPPQPRPSLLKTGSSALLNPPRPTLGQTRSTSMENINSAKESEGESDSQLDSQTEPPHPSERHRKAIQPPPMMGWIPSSGPKNAPSIPSVRPLDKSITPPPPASERPKGSTPRDTVQPTETSVPPPPPSSERPKGSTPHAIIPPPDTSVPPPPPSSQRPKGSTPYTTASLESVVPPPPPSSERPKGSTPHTIARTTEEAPSPSERPRGQTSEPIIPAPPTSERPKGSTPHSTIRSPSESAPPPPTRRPKGETPYSTIRANIEKEPFISPEEGITPPVEEKRPMNSPVLNLGEVGRTRSGNPTITPPSTYRPKGQTIRFNPNNEYLEDESNESSQEGQEVEEETSTTTPIERKPSIITPAIVYPVPDFQLLRNRLGTLNLQNQGPSAPPTTLRQPNPEQDEENNQVRNRSGTLKMENLPSLPAPPPGKAPAVRPTPPPKKRLQDKKDKHISLRKEVDPEALKILNSKLWKKLEETLIESEESEDKDKEADLTAYDFVNNYLQLFSQDLATSNNIIERKGISVAVREINFFQTLDHLKNFAEIIECIVVPPVSSTTKAAIRKPLPAFKTPQDVVVYFSRLNLPSRESSQNSRQKQWREHLELRVHYLCKSICQFSQALETQEPAKVYEFYYQAKEDITSLRNGFSYAVLAHQSIASKDVMAAAQKINTSIDAAMKGGLSGDASIEGVLQTARSVSAIMDKLGNALGNRDTVAQIAPTGSKSNRNKNNSYASNNISLEFFLSAMSEFSIKLEERASKAVLTTQDPLLGEQILDCTKEMRGAFVLLQIAISESNNDAKMKKILKSAEDDQSGSLTPYLQLSAACNSIADTTSSLVDFMKVLKDPQRDDPKSGSANELSSVRNFPNIFSDDKGPEMQWTIDVSIDQPGPKSGTWNQLVLHFFMCNDKRFKSIFMTTLPCFASALEFMKQFQDFYNGPYDSETEEVFNRYGYPLEENRDHALDLLLQFIEIHGPTLSPTSFDIVNTFLSPESYYAEDGQLKAKRKYIKQMLSICRKQIAAIPKAFDTSLLSAISCTRFIFEIPLQEIANQLTLLDQQHLGLIRVNELLNQCWSKEKTKHKAYRLLSMINRFNNISLWVSSAILWQNDEASRIESISNFISLAELLFKLRSYNALFAVISSLQSVCINRILSKYFESDKVQKKKQATYDELMQCMNPQGSFKNYRLLLDAVGDAPCIPFLGMYLTDLVFTDEGNLDYVDQDDTRINWQKHTLTYDIIAKIQRFQKVLYTYPKDEKLASFLIELPHLHKDKLRELSYLILPRPTTTSS